MPPQKTKALTRSGRTTEPLTPVPYTRLAFQNGLNYAFLATVGAVSWWSFDMVGYWPLILGAGLEAGWLAVGSRVGSFKRYFDFLHAESEGADRGQGDEVWLRTLGETDRRRYLELEKLRADIAEQAKANPQFSGPMIEAEFEKIERLCRTFLQLASTVARYENFAAQQDLSGIEDEVRRQETLVARTEEAESKRLADQNLELLRRRLEKAQEIRKQIRHQRAQLNLIENTLRLLRDQIVTISSGEELSGQIEELTQAIDSIEASSKETEALASRLDREIASLRR